MQPEMKKWLEEVLAKRANRLKVGVEALGSLEDDKEPRFVRAARTRAEKHGITYDQVLRQDRERLLESRYPGPECLEADEVEAFAAGGPLADASRQHVRTCVACTSLLQSLTPSADGVEALLAEVRSSSVERALEPTAAVNPGVAGFLTDMTFAVAPPLVTGLAAYGFVRVAPVFVLQAPWIPYLLVVAVAILIALLIVREARHNPELALALSASRGALAAGVLVAVVAPSVFIKQRDDRLEARATLTQYQLQDLALASLNTRQGGGEFLSATALVGDSSVRSEKSSADKIVYTASTAGVPGVLVAELRADSGSLWWQYGKKQDERQIRARFVAGRVKGTTKNVVMLEGPTGATQYLRVDATTSPDLQVGARIVAALDTANAAIRIQTVREVAGP